MPAELYGIPDDDRHEQGQAVPREGEPLAPPELSALERDELWRMKAAQLLEGVLDDVRRADLHPARVADYIASRLERIRPRPPATLPDMAALCRAMPGKYKRVPTQCAPLDAITGGGLQTKRCMVVGGAPGDFKTTWALFMALQIALHGASTAPTVVLYYAADEGRDGLLSRLGQMGGARRAGLEDETLLVAQAHWAHAEAFLAGVENLYVIDPTDERDPSTVEEAIELGAQRAREIGARLVVFVDSLQAAPFRSDAEGTRDRSTREKVDARITTLRQAAKKHDALVVAISELNRAAYGKDGQYTLAAFKESGSIEYGVDVGLLLKRVPDTHCTDVHVVKNRLGDKGIFRVERGPDCTFEDVPIPDEAEQGKQENEERIAQRQARIAQMADQMLEALLRSAVPITSRKDWRALVEGGGSGLKEAAISHLVVHGQVEGGGGRPFRRRYAEEESPRDT